MLRNVFCIPLVLRCVVLCCVILWLPTSCPFVVVIVIVVIVVVVIVVVVTLISYLFVRVLCCDLD